jgi:drug/metabolite transporter (DMT)-like permease
VLRDAGIQSLRTRRLGLQLLCSITGVTGVCCFFFAAQQLPIADVTVISRAVPLFVTAIAVPVLGEHVGWRRWSAFAFGLCGVILALGRVGEVSFAALVVVLGPPCGR